MIVTCGSCGVAVDHVSPGCREHRERAEEDAHVAARASGLTCPTGCPICAGLAAMSSRSLARNPWSRKIDY